MEDKANIDLSSLLSNILPLKIQTQDVVFVRSLCYQCLHSMT